MEPVPARAESQVVELVERLALIEVEVLVEMLELVQVVELIEVLGLVVLPVQLKPQGRRMDYYLNQSPLVAN